MLRSSKSGKAAPQAFFQVLRLHQMVSATLEAALAPQGLTAAQYTALSFIRHMQPLSAAELSRRLGITAQSTWETVKSLELRGWVCRSAIPNNKRSIALHLTPDGLEMAVAADRLVLAAEKSFFSRVGEADRDTFHRAIRDLRRQDQGSV
jgi:DNA-binding MarR family transcriptional regulator